MLARVCALAAALLLLSDAAAAEAPAGPDGKNAVLEAIMHHQTMPPLSPAEEAVILRKGTEPPYSGAYLDQKAAGIYICRACGAPLYTSKDKFNSGCGWPSFDDALPKAVREQPDADGHRIEITCASCGGHLGHVFKGEGFTPKNPRHCVNSLSMRFVPGDDHPASSPASRNAEDQSEQPPQPQKTATAIFAGGCFWGVEHILSLTPGVLDAESGYSGGSVPNPSYEQVCTGGTGHAEAVRVRYDPSKVSYEQLAKLFFELHDPTQRDRQGPDVGSQYRSVIFYGDETEKKTAEKLIDLLRAKGYDVVTELLPATDFYPAEEYHQDFLAKHPGRPCHLPVKRF